MITLVLAERFLNFKKMNIWTTHCNICNSYHTSPNAGLPRHETDRFIFIVQSKWPARNKHGGERGRSLQTCFNNLMQGYQVYGPRAKFCSWSHTTQPLGGWTNHMRQFWLDGLYEAHRAELTMYATRRQGASTGHTLHAVLHWTSPERWLWWWSR